MRSARGAVFTAVAAAALLVLSACGDTGQQGDSPSETPAGSTDAAPDTVAGSGAATGSDAADGASTASGSGSGSGEPSAPPATEGAPACGTPHGPYDSPQDKGGTVTVSFNEGLTSWNNTTAHGNSVYNANVVYLTQAPMFYYNDKLELINNDSYVTCTLVSTDPLRVKYSINKAAKWSDGVPVTAADLLLQWATTSGHFATGEVETDDEGNLLETDEIAFDAGSPAMALVTQFPEIGDDGRSLTITYDEPFVDYPFQLGIGGNNGGVAAHVVAMHALGIDDAAQATDALVEALRNNLADKSKDADKIKKIADFWNTGFDFTELPADKSLYLSTGPYVLSEVVKDQYMTFTRNPAYDGSWGPVPALDQITYRVIPEAMGAVQALQNQETDVIQPQATVDVLGALQNLESRGIKVLTGDGGTYEHVDLQQSNDGPFSPKSYGGDAEKAKKVRRAFLKTIPRQAIVDRLIKPLNPDAVVRQSFNVVPGSPDYDYVAENNGLADWTEVDIEGAEQLLAEVGVTDPKVRMLYADKNDRRANIYRLIAESAAKAGFQVIDGKSPDWTSKVTDPTTFDAALFGWQSTAVGASQIAPNFITGGMNNLYGYSNPEVDKLLKQLNLEPDPQRQRELILKVEQHLVQDAFGTVLFQFPQITAYNSNRIANVSSMSLAPTYFWNFWEWTVPN